jgi:hypothetical protein
VNDCFLPAEEEPLAHRSAFLVALEPPFEQTACNHCSAWIAVLAPRADLVPKLVNEFVLLGRRSGKIVEEFCFLTGDSGDSAAESFAEARKRIDGRRPLTSFERPPGRSS